MLTATATPLNDGPAASAEAATPAPPVVASGRRGVAPMRSLFWRIFLWFWLAALLLAGAVAATVYLTDPDQFFPRSRFVPLQMIDCLAHECATAFERSGEAGLRTYLDGLPRRPEANGLPSAAHFDDAYLFDGATGRELSGQPQRLDARDLVARARHSPDLQLERHVGRLYMAYAVEGGRYVFVLGMPRSSLLQPTTPQAAVELGAAVLTSALVCYWLTRYLLAPLGQLQAATRRLAEGDLGARVADAGSLARRQDEFGVLAGDFNEMAARIEDLLTAQKRLIADISHELGSPLTRLNVALGLAFRKSPDAARTELERIQTEAGRLNELIRQLLLISELQIEAKLDAAERLDLCAMATQIAADAEFEASERRCRVVVWAPGVVPVRGVRHLLHSAVENVVRNAVRYTAAESEVSIELKRTDAGGASVRVRDHGPGVPAPALANLFRPFYRVSEARDRLSGGTGLGLAITQQAIEAHGGSVRASNAPDGGLIVEMELPA